MKRSSLALLIGAMVLAVVPRAFGHMITGGIEIGGVDFFSQTGIQIADSTNTDPAEIVIGYGADLSSVTGGADLVPGDGPLVMGPDSEWAARSLSLGKDLTAKDFTTTASPAISKPIRLVLLGTGLLGMAFFLLRRAKASCRVPNLS